MASVTIASGLRELLEMKKKQLKELEEYCNREEETIRLTANLDNHTGYKYYMRENENITKNSFKKRNEIEAQIKAYTEKREAEIEVLQTQIKAYTEKKEAEIEAQKTLIRVYTEKKATEIEAIESKTNTSSEFYRNSMNDIERNLCVPKSIIYKRKMTDIIKLRQEIPDDQLRYDTAEQNETRIRQANADYRRKEAIRDILKAEEEQKAIDMKDYLARKAINDAAEERSKHKRIRKGLEPDDDGIYHTEESYDEKFATAQPVATLLEM